MSIRLFVYGSLKRGFRHHDELVGARFIRSIWTGPAYRMVRLGEYPALVPTTVPLVEQPGTSRTSSTSGVFGELYEVPEVCLPALDEFEECPTVYQRQLIELADGSSAFAYVIAEAQAEELDEVTDGCWREDQRSDMGL